MKRKNCAFLVISVLAVSCLCGCATYKSVPPTSQTQARGLAQWDQMAREVAKKIDACPNFAAKAIVMDEPEITSQFLIAYKQMIKTELMNRDFKVVEAPPAPLTLYVESQLVRHTAQYGAYSSTGQAVRSPRDPTADVGTLSHYSRPSEMLVVTTVKGDGVPVMRINQIAYVSRDEDFRLYGLSPRSSFLPAQSRSTLLEVTTQP